LKLLVTSILTTISLVIAHPGFDWSKRLYFQDKFFLPIHTPGIAVYNDIVIAPARDMLFGLRKIDGKKIWGIKLFGDIANTPDVYQDRIILSTLSGKIYIIKPENGVILNEVTLVNSSITSNFSFYKNYGYCRTNNEEVVAIDLDKGSVQWIFKKKNIQDLRISGLSAPAVKENVVITGFSDGSVSGINAIDGKEEWNIKLPSAKRFEGIYASPVIIKDRIIIPKYDSGLYSIYNNAINWARSDDGFLWCSNYMDELLCATITGKILKINPYSGNSYWVIDIVKYLPRFPEKKLLALSTPAISQDVMYISTGYGVLGIELNTQRVIWGYKSPGVLFSPGVTAPVVIDSNRLFIINNTGILYSFILRQ